MYSVATQYTSSLLRVPENCGLVQAISTYMYSPYTVQEKLKMKWNLFCHM